ncbi:unnamed protein product [Lota lota]
MGGRRGREGGREEKLQPSSELHAAKLSPGHTLPASPHPSMGSGRHRFHRVIPGTEPDSGKRVTDGKDPPLGIKAKRDKHNGETIKGHTKNVHGTGQACSLVPVSSLKSGAWGWRLETEL